ncbi:Alpha/Beta hydrolase protein [Halteromyces radiatus]|uniref:Alpha/Beta hydrolase protein n=1 Tax=Halteromyces radiatus TaxID=101107 RepID=UPI00221E46F0|nr:Alpha/Beta hydrolase protein [Halteromyces radiatus]KAI8086705.1 Alpha/Beta hydrolase protein [Halteromyces radiatus]
MSTVQVHDEWITASDGQKLFTKTWKLSSTPKANLLIVHGFGEHCARYDAVCRVLAESGIQTHAFDERGWGETGKKDQSFGNNQGYKTALNDINEAVHRTKQANIPLFLLGHSMGGGLILNYVARKDEFDGVSKLNGVIASAPLVILTKPVSPLKYYPLKLASYITPSFGIRADMDPSFMSHDQDEIEKYKNDPLIHDYATIGTVGSFLDAGKNLLNIGSNITLPILFSHGDEDPVNSHEATQRLYHITSSTDKEFKSWEGLYHELHNERKEDREKVIEYYANWINKHL